MAHTHNFILDYFFRIQNDSGVDIDMKSNQVRVTQLNEITKLCFALPLSICYNQSVTKLITYYMLRIILSCICLLHCD